ncbi:PREDICTED: aldehyde dehydrogenase family 8 member A1 isoform X2 [Gekko japonicus]|uniref:Aldehyde dehydrogenase family 8 member A1 isoform X2 n=1 Tax=Gekko japonicus TaxID=146911 RepID=A0ABM1K207_GEKJA|nr:PREDICTED: aldehyde dehydrogenase family 8 member A1 isoform X2 [Gekko japonicus]
MASSKAALILENYIGGQFVPCASYLDSYDPSIGEVYCKVPDSGKEEVEAAVKAAQNAFPGWSAKSPQDRSKIMSKLADLIEEDLESFAQAESKDQGKTITFARMVDIPRAIYNFRFFSSSILHQTSESTQMDHMDCMHYTVRTPVGIGFPPGVVNIIFGHGSKAGDALVSHPKVPLISFTGSTLTGQRIIERSAPFCKKLSLELGGKNPAIIFEDAILDKCIPATVRSSFANQGEICLCTSRIFVQRTIYSEFLKRFVEAVKKWKVGSPSDPTTDVGALISKEHLAKVKNSIKKAQEEGVRILCGEGKDLLFLHPRNQNGYFLLPTVIADIEDNSCCMQDEIFGPVTCITVFDTEEEVITRANGVKYGLAATVWSRNVGQVHRVAKRLQCGLVWTNCWLIRDLNLPFGGIKASGIGREGAKDSYEFFTESKTITIKH